MFKRVVERSANMRALKKQIITDDIFNTIGLVREVSDLPVAIGFGISTPEQAKNMAQKADGVIVGSAIVKIIAENGKNSPQKVYDYVKEIVDNIR